MIPIGQITKQQAQDLKGVFFDLDDTFLDGGLLGEEAYQSLFRLRESGLRLIALTGRPASWGELIARMWPVEAAISENGAIAFTRKGTAIECVDTAPAEARAERRERLLGLVAEARALYPSLTPSDDVAGRISDFTFDIGEHKRESEEVIQGAIAFAQKAGAKTSRSSVHLHYSFDRADKATGAIAYLHALGSDSTSALTRFAFIGDSENDASVFAAFRIAVGVQNVHGNFSIPPRYVTTSPRSAGFCEFASHLADLRAP
jgi:HAD superfamily hydrolase (TIGR01484 family)